MTFLHPMPVLNIWLGRPREIKLKYLTVCIIRSDPIWKIVRVTEAGAATAEVLAAMVAAAEGLEVQDLSSRLLCE